MCALVTFTSFALAATSAVLLVLAATNGKLKNNKMNNIENNHTSLLDPDGPNVQFILFTRSHPPFNLRINDFNGFKKSGFNFSNPVKIIIHGFQSSIEEDIFVVNKNAYLDSGDYNVIGMDWSVLCEFEYLSAIGGVRKAGKVLGEFLTWLSVLGVDYNNIHLVGHSLGAHVAGIGGHEVKNGKIGRITGLDPAAPGFKDIEAKLKLDANDAKMVDVVHTYMKVLSLAQPVGHVDFYPNGGRRQPGCPEISDIWKFSESVICNHARAYYYFAESIRNKRAFRSNRCNNVEEALRMRCVQATSVYMGQVESYKNGLYFFRTNAKRPFSLSR
ncbi:phospholipase A1 member A [Tribolium castaneum]|uniref:Vitellogenin-3-like Protein n=1 Tax=Tribolium castaneum TaxID=7070 RepID=D6WG64_TRICA|nr:PREDICTED: phospholipase A1 member A [Tribolium castaneum]EFA00197.1 Vitellogenin-3-like Protein [Tribolium castaneum]|eukprot:XP_015833245.1 PREDICTED: phospholipase A1 member A [Tribolium castaneum]